MHEPKALPISVEATVKQAKHDISEAAGAFRPATLPKPLSGEEFEKKRAEILKTYGGGSRHD